MGITHLGHTHLMEPLLEDLPIQEIKAFFEDRGYTIAVGSQGWFRPTYQEWRRLPRSVRRAVRRNSHTFWAHLGSVRAFGSGVTEQEAIRAAAKRYRYEQLG